MIEKEGRNLHRMPPCRLQVLDVFRLWRREEISDPRPGRRREHPLPGISLLDLPVAVVVGEESACTQCCCCRWRCARVAASQGPDTETALGEYRGSPDGRRGCGRVHV